MASPQAVPDASSQYKASLFYSGILNGSPNQGVTELAVNLHHLPGGWCRSSWVMEAGSASQYIIHWSLSC